MTEIKIANVPIYRVLRRVPWGHSDRHRDYTVVREDGAVPIDAREKACVSLHLFDTEIEAVAFHEGLSASGQECSDEVKQIGVDTWSVLIHFYQSSNYEVVRVNHRSRANNNTSHDSDSSTKEALKNATLDEILNELHSRVGTYPSIWTKEDVVDLIGHYDDPRLHDASDEQFDQMSENFMLANGSDLMDALAERGNDWLSNRWELDKEEIITSALGATPKP